MLTLQDCIELSGLNEKEILAIAEHEHIPEIVALELGSYLAKSQAGVEAVEQMIIDDIEAAQVRGDSRHAAVLRIVLKRFGPHLRQAV